MAANLFGRYVWLIDVLLRYKRLTFQEINALWQKSGLGYGEELPLRTFHNHQKAIKDIFDVYIECDRKDGFRYYIDEPGRVKSSSLRSWLISSYATLNQIRVDNKRLGERILFEDIPSSRTWLTRFVEAMRNNNVVSITYREFGERHSRTFEIEPYYLKVVKRRWYVLARNSSHPEEVEEKGTEPEDVYRVYALDHISDIQDAGRTFKMNKNFNIDRYFDGCCGMITSDEPTQRVVLQAHGNFADYLRTLPLHESQREIESDDESPLFEYQLKPTIDFYQFVLAQGGQLEVREPESVREAVRNYAQKLLDCHT